MAASRLVPRLARWKRSRYISTGVCVTSIFYISVLYKFYKFSEEYQPVDGTPDQGGMGAKVPEVNKNDTSISLEALLPRLHGPSSKKSNSTIRNKDNPYSENAQRKKENMQATTVNRPSRADPAVTRATAAVTQSPLAGLTVSCNRKSFNREMESAIERASTHACKQELANVSCDLLSGRLFPKSLPRYCKSKGIGNITYLGCYRDVIADRDLSNYGTVRMDHLTVSVCLNLCLRTGYKYAGVQYGRECFCGNNYGKHGRATEDKCDYPCKGNASETCGGYQFQSVYTTGVGDWHPPPSAWVDPPNVAHILPARIAFVLTVHGRAVRQVKRMIKAIYNANHYYFIHVDVRCDYMYNELLPLERQFDNVRLARHRLTAIWGGASLLQMLLLCMRQLLNIAEWKWDFFLNLSESDFPIKRDEELTAYMTSHKGKSFVKGHGINTQKFISKQGLDHTFYECDTHMWRIGHKRLPDGILIDGGSDWVALSRDMCAYITYGNDELIGGLHRVWKYSLLPAESFFHTVLRNSHLCETFIHNNLHITNWNRKRGCKCQYKAIVDWCGCSPQDFVAGEERRFKAHLKHPVYFARKFEAIVSQQVIHAVDTWLYGKYPEGTPGLISYWQNEYHHKFEDPPPSDDYMSMYITLAQLSARHHQFQCPHVVRKVHEATVFQQYDKFRGLLVLYEAANTLSKRPLRFETFFQPHQAFRHVTHTDGFQRLRNMEVSSNWDPKEDIFRNFAGLLGPRSKPELRMTFGSGKENLRYQVAWLDPASRIQSVSIHALNNSHWNISRVQPPALQYPLMPGRWQVLVIEELKMVASTSFLVIPSLYANGVPITRPEQSRHVNSGAPQSAAFKYGDLEQQLALTGQKALVVAARENANKHGAALAQWATDLAALFWKVSGSCYVTDGISGCGELRACSNASWSSRSPDPKSEMGKVNLKTGRIR